MKRKNFSFFIGYNRGMPSNKIVENFFVFLKRPVLNLKSGRLCLYKQTSAAQVTFEYFILFSTFAAICLLSAGAIFEKARGAALTIYKDEIQKLELNITLNETVFKKY